MDKDFRHPIGREADYKWPKRAFNIYLVKDEHANS